MENKKDISNLISQQLKATLGNFGSLMWAYVVMSKQDMSRIFDVTNYPGRWVERYKECGLQYTDPVVMTAMNRLTSFFWDETFDQADKFGVTNGYTAVLHDYYNNLVTLSFIIDDNRKNEMVKNLSQNKGEISVLLATVHERYLVFNSLPEKNALYSDKNIQFTNRENEIFYWASIGKTYHEIGIILAIKTSTIKFHMANIIKKLDVNNARHAIRLGMELQLIKPIH